MLHQQALDLAKMFARIMRSIIGSWSEVKWRPQPVRIYDSLRIRDHR